MLGLPHEMRALSAESTLRSVSNHELQISLASRCLHSVCINRCVSTDNIFIYCESAPFTNFAIKAIL